MRLHGLPAAPWTAKALGETVWLIHEVWAASPAEADATAWRRLTARASRMRTDDGIVSGFLPWVRKPETKVGGFGQNRHFQWKTTCFWRIRQETKTAVRPPLVSNSTRQMPANVLAASFGCFTPLRRQVTGENGHDRVGETMANFTIRHNSPQFGLTPLLLANGTGGKADTIIF